jgi:hypothetical protein
MYHDRYRDNWIQSKAIKGYVTDIFYTYKRPMDWASLILCPWYHCAFGWVKTSMTISGPSSDIEFLDQEEVALLTLGNLGK